MISAQTISLCGCPENRLWPLPRTGSPKPFPCSTGDERPFRQSVQRLANLDKAKIQVAVPIIVAVVENRFLATEQLREAGIELRPSLLEPVGRVTAAALTLAAGADPELTFTPADLVVFNPAAPTTAMQHAVTESDIGTVVTRSVTPIRPETGYSFIKASPVVPVKVEAIQVVQRFVEKPEVATARTNLDEGNYWWNAVIFVPDAPVGPSAPARFRADTLNGAQTARTKRSSCNKYALSGKSVFADTPYESADYVAAEHRPGSSLPIKMVSLDAGCNDLCAWAVVWNVLPKDANGNSHLGDALNTISKNTLVHATSRIVSLVGLENVSVVETQDAVMIADKFSNQDVKFTATQLQKIKRKVYTLHRDELCPGGWYDSIDKSGRCKVKLIQIKPRARLSHQKLHHRAEHWIVVSRIAENTNGNKVLTLTENQSTNILLGGLHRLANPGNIPLEIIEVLSSGGYPGEDDIVLLEDTYGGS